MANSRTIRRPASLAVMAAGVAAGIILPMAPSSAAGPLTAQMGCESLGESRIACDAFASGGTAPYTYTWSLGPSFRGQSVSFGCFRGSSVRVTVTVTDAAGTSVSLTAGAFCSGGPPH
ncbi:MAG: hypothetical protein V7637_4445 [Mycobacteriales bacterium]|jgi:hypothetical protein